MLRTFHPLISGLPWDSVTASRTWRVHLPFIQVYRWIRAHQPRGSGPGDFNDIGVGWSANRQWPIADRGDGYGYPVLADRIDRRELDLDVWHFVRHRHWTRIRADVDETWVVARPSDEKIPSGVRTIVIHGPGRRVRRVTRVEQVGRIVHWIDALPLLQQFGGECGLHTAPYRPVKISFLGATSKILARVLDPRTGLGRCSPLSFHIGNRAEPPLDPGYESTDLRLERLGR